MIWRAVERQDLSDPAWILELDADDEPPLFTHVDELAFLERVAPEDRGPALLEVTLQLLERMAETVRTSGLQGSKRFFCCATFSDFDAWRRREQPAPRPALLVLPHEERIAPRWRFTAAHTEDGLVLDGWLSQLAEGLPERHCVAEREDALSIDPGLRRVYVGQREAHTEHYRSVGFYLSAG